SPTITGTPTINSTPTITPTPTTTLTSIPTSTPQSGSSNVSGLGSVTDQDAIVLGNIPNLASLQIIRDGTKVNYSGTFLLYEDSFTLVGSSSGVDPSFPSVNVYGDHSYTVVYQSEQAGSAFFYSSI